MAEIEVIATPRKDIKMEKNDAETKKQQELERRLFGNNGGSSSLWAVTSDLESSENDEDDEQPVSKRSKKSTSNAVWEDEDDANIAVDGKYLRKIAPDSKVARDLGKKQKTEKIGKELRQKYAELAGVGRKPEWLQKIEEDKQTEKTENVSEDSDEEEAIAALNGMSRTSKKWLSTSKSLPREYLQVNRLPDPTAAQNTDGLRALRFHPTQPVLIVASQSAVQLFQVSQTTTNLQRTRGDSFLQSVSIKRCDLDYMALHDDGASIFLSSSKNSGYYSYNLLDGHLSRHEFPMGLSFNRHHKMNPTCRLSTSGRYLAMILNLEVHVYILNTMEHVHTFKANSEVVDLSFSAMDENKIFGLTATGNGYVWDLRVLNDQHTFQDEGSFCGTTLCVSSNEQFLACGSNTGVVNVYNASTVTNSTEPKPLYTLLNLTTSVDFLNFNRNNEMLAIGSKDKAMAYRIVHMQTGTVFKNFPPKQEMLAKDHYCCADFSPNGGFAAFGNSTGPVRLYRLNHYKTY
ncbi:U3 small nucleolar RNA-associated protein 18-like protein [Aphelenchoides besseyi]|nr:U3 small nucleolar RNA-associated protein 18-like protein [Aphelenchoides besseyi]KAI6200160.1 U3 small nucleolar RNA-associated protein 18-like protein [Aphelenchoides besseyi]